MMNENNEIVKLKEECDLEMKSLRAELREIKLRETRLFAECSELEEENISLQKQVSLLKSSQVRIYCVPRVILYLSFVRKNLIFSG